MTFLLSHWRVAALIGACLAGLGLYTLGKHDGRQQAAMAAAEATAKAIQKRAKIDDAITGLDVRGLCLELGGGVSDCDQLRRFQSNPD